MMAICKWKFTYFKSRYYRTPFLDQDLKDFRIYRIRLSVLSQLQTPNSQLSTLPERVLGFTNPPVLLSIEFKPTINLCTINGCGNFDLILTSSVATI